VTERDSDELGQDEAAHALVAQYFDGELAPEREAEALAHLASCPACQRELGDLIGLHVALERGAASQDGEGSAAVHVAEPLPARPAPADSDDELSRRRARRRRVLAGALVLAAAAAAAVWIVRKPDTAVPQLALANTRGMEPRFSAEPFARHRPYSVVRGAAAREDLSLDTLAKLERAGQRDVLAAALAATGELDRARAQLVQAPASPRRPRPRSRPPRARSKRTHSSFRRTGTARWPRARSGCRSWPPMRSSESRAPQSPAGPKRQPRTPAPCASRPPSASPSTKTSSAAPTP
jgi:hypothetical protein